VGHQNESEDDFGIDWMGEEEARKLIKDVQYCRVSWLERPIAEIESTANELLKNYIGLEPEKHGDDGEE